MSLKAFWKGRDEHVLGKTNSSHLGRVRRKRELQGSRMTMFQVLQRVVTKLNGRKTRRVFRNLDHSLVCWALILFLKSVS